MKSTLQHLFKAKFAHMTFLGFSAGIPLFLIFSSLSLWLQQVGVERSAITLFSWAALGYSFKFLWSPLVDRLPIPLLTRRLGQRRGWLLLAQLMVVMAMIAMALTDPAQSESALTRMALAAVLLGFSAATQDIVIDALRIEYASQSEMAMVSGVYIAGYRLGMIVSGVGTLYLADMFGTSMETYYYPAWRLSYLIMASLMTIGLVTTWVIKEPHKVEFDHYKTLDYFGVLWVFVASVAAVVVVFNYTGDARIYFNEFLVSLWSNNALASVLSNSLQMVSALTLAGIIGWLVSRFWWVNRPMIAQVYVAPLLDIIQKHKKHVWLLIGIIATYRISDLVMGAAAYLFYQDLGYNLKQIADASKLIGLIMTFLGGILGGYLAIKFGVLKVMILGASLSALSNLLFMWMVDLDKSFPILMVMISADNLSAGLALAAFVTFLSFLVNKKYTAVQYAMFSSVMTLFPKILGGYSGGMIDAMGYAQFFFTTFLMGLPVVLLLLYAEKIKLIKQPDQLEESTETD